MSRFHWVSIICDGRNILVVLILVLLWRVVNPMPAFAHIVSLDETGEQAISRYKFGNSTFRLTANNRFLITNTSFKISEKEIVEFAFLVVEQDLVTFTDIDDNHDWKVDPSELGRNYGNVEKVFDRNVRLYHDLYRCPLRSFDLSLSAQSRQLGQVFSVRMDFVCSSNGNFRLANDLVFRFAFPTLVQIKVENREHRFYVLYEQDETIVPIMFKQPKPSFEFATLFYHGPSLLPLLFFVVVGGLILVAVPHGFALLWVVLVFTCAYLLMLITRVSSSSGLEYIAAIIVGGAIVIPRITAKIPVLPLLLLGASLIGTWAASLCNDAPLLSTLRWYGILGFSGFLFGVILLFIIGKLLGVGSVYLLRRRRRC